jgi:hypothetical protein
MCVHFGGERCVYVRRFVQIAAQVLFSVNALMKMLTSLSFFFFLHSSMKILYSDQV